MNKKFFFGFLSLMLILLALLHLNADTATAFGHNQAQTIPTRTPTPAPPTATPSGGGNGNNNPTPTNTPINDSAPTATSTLIPVNIAPTPVGGFLPTAVPCGANPTIQTLDATNVRSGPGTEYEIIGVLVFLEVRNIVGRAETAEWWLIQFNDGQLGWVANNVVNVQGYTAIVPLVEAPLLNGSTPVPGPVWNPTPPPFCTVTPPPTNTATAVPTEPPAEPAEAADTATPAPTDPPATEARPSSTPIAQATAVPINPTVPPTTPDSTPEEESSGNMGLILLGAAGLLGAGIFLFTRKRPG